MVVKQLHLDICTQNAIQLQKFELISIPQKKIKTTGKLGEIWGKFPLISLTIHFPHYSLIPSSRGHVWMIFHTDSKPSITFYGMFFRLAKPGFLLSRSCNHVSGCEKWLWSWRKSLFLKTRTQHFTQRLERASRLFLSPGDGGNEGGWVFTVFF